MIAQSSRFNVIASVFDEADTAFINALYDELIDADLALSRFANFVPHITYSALNFSDDTDAVVNVLEEFTQRTPPFVIKTTSLGIFTGELPVLYIQIVRTPQLNRLQLEIADTLAPFAAESNPHFQPNVWLPHLTIGWPKGADELGTAVKMLSQRNFQREILIDNITIMFHDDTKSPQRFELKGK